MSDQTLVYANTSVTSADGQVNIGRHTSSIQFYNTHASTDAVVKINGGPHSVLIPSTTGGVGYVDIDGDYTSFEIMTASVTIAVIALG